MSFTVSLIAAMDEARLIGVNNRLPWQLPADMQWFRKHTLGKAVVMGRKTYESIGKALPKRVNIVVTRDPNFQAAGCLIAHNIDEALAMAADHGEEAMIMGGASFYEQLLPRADRLYITRVHGRFAGDAWFPDFEQSAWNEVEREEYLADERNAYACSFIVLERERN